MRFSRLNPIESRRKIPPLTVAAEAVNNQNHLSANGEKVPIGTNESIDVFPANSLKLFSDFILSTS